MKRLGLLGDLRLEENFDWKQTKVYQDEKSGFLKVRLKILGEFAELFENAIYQLRREPTTSVPMGEMHVDHDLRKDALAFLENEMKYYAETAFGIDGRSSAYHKQEPTEIYYHYGTDELDTDPKLQKLVENSGMTVEKLKQELTARKNMR